MPLMDVSNPKVINFLIENYEKESRLRAKWFNLHKEKIEKCATLKVDTKNYTHSDIAEATMISGMEAITRDHVSAVVHRFRKPVPDYLLAKVETVRKIQPPMIAATSSEKDILKESRKSYLNMRNKRGPDDKYLYMESENWKYGWKLNESELKLRGPEHGKINHLLHSLVSRVGPQPDPVHYALPDTGYECCGGSI